MKYTRKDIREVRAGWLRIQTICGLLFVCVCFSAGLSAFMYYFVEGKTNVNPFETEAD
jgi:hypothetical protein